MAYKVFDFTCPKCDNHLYDILTYVSKLPNGDDCVHAERCPKCGELMDRNFPAPAGYVYDSKQEAYGKAAAKAFKTKAASRRYRKGSPERVEAEKEYTRLMKAGQT